MTIAMECPDCRTITDAAGAIAPQGGYECPRCKNPYLLYVLPEEDLTLPPPSAAAEGAESRPEKKP